MSPILFWTFAALMLGFGLSVILQRNPVASALSLVASFIALAALYVSLNAFFIGIIQILVYAGAVMVLFLFIIMLLDLKAEVRRKINKVGMLGGGLIVALFVIQLVSVLNRYPGGKRTLEPLAGRVDDVREVGTMLFSNYNFPFQVIGVLVLVATIGVVILSKRELK